MTFHGFSTDSFEQFIRALSIKILGPGVTAFGNGPDGGREAAFKGKINYPSPSVETWNGYGVIQAKFKEKTETTAKDQAWALAQLKKELELWRSNDNRKPKPLYYVFCTNVKLSSGSKGGHEKLSQALDEYKASNDLVDYAIWDGNQLTAYVDAYSEIRQRFCNFFTTGDFLSNLSANLLGNANPDAVLHSFLCRELAHDEDAKLSQAGDRSEDRIRLASVFVDLAASEAGLVVEEDGERRSLHILLQAASLKLDPFSLMPQNEQQDYDPHSAVFGRFVFIGGPGSGKSTMGQFLAQVHRAALLERRPDHRLEPKIKEIIKEIKDRCSEEDAPWPKTPRFPIRVDLNAFAKALSSTAKDGASSLSEYFRQQISSDIAISHQTIMAWIQTFPWLIVLDGLDEVPSSSNRNQVIDAIRIFLNEARDLEADLMVVSSSRPDGYSGEFDGGEVKQLYLTPFSKLRAIACAQRYIDAKSGSLGRQRASEAMLLLKQAVENPLIEKLMQSPLQVTFMVTVVAASGKPSDSRWQLFNDYYRIIYERELHKAVRPFDKVLNERRQDIDALHHRVGFILQNRAELTGNTQADLAKEEFERLVIDCLKENGLDTKELDQQKEMILGAANLRLVFLTSRTPGRLSFDVRSLQEYMAAACMTNADSDQIIRTVELIAHSSYWRNTLLFAIGRLFVEPQGRAHRDKVRVLCDDLNRKDPERAAIKLGSWLALDILESGTIGNVPLVTRSLADCALGLLDQPLINMDTAKRLAELYDPDVISEYRNRLTARLGQKKHSDALQGWMVLFYLEQKNIAWAVELADQSWPTDTEYELFLVDAWLSGVVSFPTTRRHIVPPQGRTDINRYMAERIVRLIPRVSFGELHDLISRTKIARIECATSWFEPLIRFLDDKNPVKIEMYLGDKTTSLSLSCNALPNKDVAEKYRGASAVIEYTERSDWIWLKSLLDFCIDPSLETLAAAVEKALSFSDATQIDLLLKRAPWPVACCVEFGRQVDKKEQIVQRIREGNCGDLPKWIDIEEKWKIGGMQLEDLCEPLYKNGPCLLPAVSTASFSRIGKSGVVNKRAADLLMSVSKRSNNSIQSSLSWIMSFYFTCSDTLIQFEPADIEHYVLGKRKPKWEATTFCITDRKLRPQISKWLPFFDAYGRKNDMFFSPHGWYNSNFPLEQILNCYVEDNSLVGLLRISGFICGSGRRMTKKYRELTKISLASIEEPRYRLAMVLVLMSFEKIKLADVEEIVAYLPSIIGADAEPGAIAILLSALELYMPDSPQLTPIFKALSPLMSKDTWQTEARAIELQKLVLSRRSSGFDERRLKAFGLPVLRQV